MRWIAIGLLLASTSTAVAQVPHPRAPTDGLYEEWSSLEMRPVGPLSSPPTILPRWVSVHSAGPRTTVRFEPQRRVEWRIQWGPHGAVSKETVVDGVAFTRSTFRYDGRGHLIAKRVDGPGVPSPITFTYGTDAQGRIVSRTGTLPRRVWWSGQQTVTARTAVRRTARTTTVEVHYGSRLVRRDVSDGTGRRLSTVFFASGPTGTAQSGPPRRLELVYVRSPNGRLRRVERRRLGARPSPADFTTRDPSVSHEDVSVLVDAPVERHEVLLLLGSPVRATVEGSGAARRMRDDYSGDCWLNQVNGFSYDASGLAIGNIQSCICGFCVDAALETSGEDVLATDHHWTSGPWIRLDGRVDVTADHRVMTPDGPRPAGELAAGDAILRDDGTAHRLRSVEQLPVAEPRLGRNLRTASGVFAAGGFLFESEQPRPCTD